LVSDSPLPPSLPPSLPQDEDYQRFLEQLKTGPTKLTPPDQQLAEIEEGGKGR